MKAKPTVTKNKTLERNAALQLVILPGKEKRKRLLKRKSKQERKETKRKVYIYKY